MGRKAIDIAGKRYGMLVALNPVGTAASGQVLWKCVCDCGAIHTVLSQSLRSGRSTRCPQCARAGVTIPEDGGLGATLIVELWMRGIGETGGFATVRSAATGELITHSHWNRRPLADGQHWKTYGAVQFVLDRLVKTNKARRKRSDQTLEAWARRNAIMFAKDAHWVTGDPRLKELWAECLASGTGPEVVELERPAGDRRVATVT